MLADKNLKNLKTCGYILSAMKTFVSFLPGYLKFLHKHIKVQGTKTCSYLRTDKKKQKQKQNQETLQYIHCNVY